jgi:Tol biopolymer transport system component
MAAASAQALVIPMTTKQLCDSSQTIVVATVDSLKAARTDAATAPLVGSCTIETGVRLRVLEVLKGAAPSELTIHVPGGRLGGTTTVVSDPVSFARGRSYVIFLDDLGRVVGAWQGNPAVSAGRVAGTGLTLTAFERQLAGLTGEAPQAVRPRALGALRRAAAKARPQAAASPARGKAPLPVIKSISPRAGSAGTDTKVTITGQGFGAKQSGAARVQFYYGKQSGRPDDSARISAPVVSWSAARIVCKVPAAQIESYKASAGSGPLTVRNMWGRESKSIAFSVSFGYWGARWKPAECTYRIALPSERPELQAGVEAAIGEWNAAGAAFEFIVAQASSSSRSARAGATANLIDWGPLAAGVIAQSSADYTGKLFAKDAVYTSNAIRLNSNESWGDGQSGTYDAQSVALHELGHALGLRDLYGPADNDKAMYGWGDSRSSPTVPLTAADAAGIQWIYGEQIPPGQIAYVHTDYSLGASQGRDEVWLMESDGSQARRICEYLGDVVDLQWEPDGGRLAMVTQDPDWTQRLWTMAADGSDLLQLHPSLPSADWIDDPSGTMGGLAWSPSGDRIALTYAVYGAHGDAIASWVLAVDPAASKVTSLAGPTDGIAYHDLAWAPNGFELVASSTSVIAESGWLSRIDARTGADLGYLVSPGYFEYWQDPAFSPDGQWIASAVTNVAALITNQGTVTHGITLVSTGGATRRVISESKTLFWGNPSWSPNGRWVVADRGPRDAMHIVFCRTSVRSPAVDTGVDGQQPVWRPGMQAAAGAAVQ